MKWITAAILPVLWFAAAHAEQPKNLEATMGDIAKDLATLQKDVDLVSQKPTAYGFATLKGVKLTGKSVPIYKGAADFSGLVMKLPEGKVLPVVDKAGEWYAVGLDQPNIGYKSGWVHASSVVPETYTLQTQTKPTTDSMYQQIMDKVKGFKEKYENNPYVRVTGFSVDIAIPPAVSISFEFK